MVEPENKPEIEIDWDSLEEQWSDLFGAQVNPWGAAVTFGLRSVRLGEPNKMTLRMRMSLQQAKALGVLLLRDIRAFEQRTQTEIGLPANILEELGIPKEDWERFRGL